MKIPIFNTLYNQSYKLIESKPVDFSALNNLNFSNVDLKKYPMVNILKYLPEKNSLFETVIVSANDTLVNLFLNKKIKFADLNTELIKFIKHKDFINYKNKSPKNIRDIVYLIYHDYKVLSRFYFTFT